MRKDLAALRIINYPDPRLRKVCKPVEAFDEELAGLAGRMLELMRESQGIGLAAPQVGKLIRLFVCNVTGDPKDDLVFVNPVLSDLAGHIEGEEGCLSIPDVTVTMQRAASCRMTARDLSGKPIDKKAELLMARCWQHECDHLNGRLIVDQMSETDRIANRRKLRELERSFKC